MVSVCASVPLSILALCGYANGSSRCGPMRNCKRRPLPKRRMLALALGFPRWRQRRSTYSRAQLFLPVLMHVFVIPAALGQEASIPETCKRFVPPVDKLNYENEMHRKWYVSWWDGRCEGLPSWPFCQSKPYWETIGEPVLKQYPDADRKTLLKELCILGQVLGHEFARDNDLRCIDRDDLSAWADKLSSSRENIFQTVAEVRSEAEARVKRAKQGRPCLER